MDLGLASPIAPAAPTTPTAFNALTAPHEHRRFRIQLPGVPPDHVEVELFAGEAGFDLDACYRVRIASNHLLDPSGWLGQRASLAVALAPQPSVIHGLITACTEVAQPTALSCLELQLRSPLYALCGHFPQRVLRNATASEAARQLLTERLPSWAEVVSVVTGEERRRPLSIQSHESDWELLQRLLAQAGLWLLLRQQEEGVSVVLGDDLTALEGGTVALSYHRHSGQVQGVGKSVYALRRWSALAVTGDAPQTLGGVEIETNCCLAPGMILQLTDHPDPSLNDSYRVLHVAQSGDQAAAMHGGTGCGRASFVCRAQLLPVFAGESALAVMALLPSLRRGFGPGLNPGVDPEQEWRASFVAAPRRGAHYAPPVQGGLMLAEIEGTTPGQAHLDRSGAYRLRFALDGSDASPATASPPVPSLQPYGGRGYGMHWPLLPRTQVAVAGLDGDAEQPVVLGALGSEQQPLPVTGLNPYEHLLCTPAGHRLSCDDRPGGERLHLVAAASAGELLMEAGGAGGDLSEVAGEAIAAEVVERPVGKVGGEDNAEGEIGSKTGTQTGAKSGDTAAKTENQTGRAGASATGSSATGSAARLVLRAPQGDLALSCGGSLAVVCGADRRLDVAGSYTAQIGGDYSVEVGGGALSWQAAGDWQVTTTAGDLTWQTAAGAATLSAATTVNVEAGQGVSLQSAAGDLAITAADGDLSLRAAHDVAVISDGDGVLTIGNAHGGIYIGADGEIRISGLEVTLSAQQQIVLQADEIVENGA
ncbi:hypothetical protein CKO15_01930 [Halorhodospira abdelmalekii]|uniref:contractile injection system protein, VgrG/Pvc8 family n=1 Tax=Halorhodospira abdelmalekii TaxID=421629 RepID=UPI001904EF17|nr:contractile injection system protein, VgrG/Pvc8 family [Halorhodospira abdelmalekii]MBK1734058.1 hypothetical protein [Halorhodospira abdelmalekii]